MGSLFVIRPIPIDGESLSGYLMRLLENNGACMDIFELIKEVQKPNSKFDDSRFHHQIDSNSFGKLDTDKLMKLAELDSNTLAAMTFCPLYEKFIVMNETSLNSMRSSLLMNCIETNHRRFCPTCLRQYSANGQNGVYQLHWQISSLTHCNIHNEPLISTCPKCGTIQPYLTTSLGSYTCFECGEKLFEDTECCNDNPILLNNNQFEFWSYLLDGNIKGLERVPGMIYEYQMVITLLYLLHVKHPVMVLKKTEKDRAMMFLKNRCTNVFVTPYILSTVLSRADIPVSEFFNTAVPDSFISEQLNANLEAYKELGEKRKKIRQKIRKKDSNEIKTQVNNYIHNRPRRKKRLTKTEVYTSISIYPESMTSDTKKWISDMVKEYNSRQQEAIIKEIEDIAKELLYSNGTFTHKEITDRLGVYERYIERRKEIIIRLKKVRENFFLN